MLSWQDNRDANDVLISLNTGAGKTIVGLLIAQSLVNEGLDNVLYICSTIDLVHQTGVEAERLGIDHTTRVRRAFSNDLFEAGRAFCITTYAALFNGHSALRRRFFPDAVVFDDAHVAEDLLRGSFTLRIDSQRHVALFGDISGLFEPYFRKLGAAGRFADAIDPSRHTTILVPPDGLYRRNERLMGLLLDHGVKDTEPLTYPFAWLQDKLHAYSAVFSRGVFELAPPFLPSRALDIFNRDIRRIYLSATLQSDTNFIRAFGREPAVSIAPSNDAGNGERLFVTGHAIKRGFGPAFAAGFIETRKAVIAVPDYARAKAWSQVAEPPKTEEFTDALNDFREADTGAFILVARVDGIDLPHDTCRIMIVDGLPSGSSALERYQWEYLRMNNVHAVRIANRLAQLFGRINRGRNDYGAFLIEGDELFKWLSNDRNLALFPPLLRQQILVGREVQTSFDLKRRADAVEVVDRVLQRDESWLEYYQQEVKFAELDREQLQRHENAEPHLRTAALSEAKYAAAMWNNDPARARRELEKTADETAKHDTPLGGWHALWLGAAYYLEGDAEASAIAYANARRRLGNEILLPPSKARNGKKAQDPDLNTFGAALRDLLSYTHGNKFQEELEKVRSSLLSIGNGNPGQAEAGVRLLGELLGFDSTRPDNDEGTGPDVLWRDPSSMQMTGFELKTDKVKPATYSKKEISQGHDHLQWMAQNYPEYEALGLLYVGPEGTASGKATPSRKMALSRTQTMLSLANKLIGLLEDLRSHTPLERLPAIVDTSQSSEWTIQRISGALRDRDLSRTVRN